MTKKNTKKALLLSVLSLVVCFSMLVGTTFAWFTDSVSSANNVIASGNLDVALEYWDGDSWEDVAGADDIFDPNALWEPGYADVVYFRISNAGSLAMQYSFVMNIISETVGKNVAGESFKLSDHLQYGIVHNKNGETDEFATREDAIAAVTTPKSLGNDTLERVNGTMASGDPANTFAIVVWMPTTVGNEANYGSVAPKIELGFSVIATQNVAESDGFGTDYDADAKLDGIAVGGATVNATGRTYLEFVNNQSAKKGYAYIPSEAVADTDKIFKMFVEEVGDDATIAIATDETIVSYEITAENLKEGNTAPIEVALRVPTGLNQLDFKVYHNGTQIPVKVYDAAKGYIVFETTSFSPFSVVYKENPTSNGTPTPENLPVAGITLKSEYENVELPWEEGLGQFSPNPNYDAFLEGAFEFDCVDTPEEAAASPYANWICDFYVKLDRELGENQIFLGGNYGDFGWIGFHNGDVVLATNQELPLLGSVMGEWTYTMIAESVGTFTCGVGDVDDALAGATFTVSLRLTNPENANEYYDVAVVEYTFAGTDHAEKIVVNGVEQ